jgi:predicted house-cleaning NTP pyrophosphatase (Maf/HAM1 superfamily)
VLVSGIEGCYYNVVGLPLTRLFEMLASIGVSAWEWAEKAS